MHHRTSRRTARGALLAAAALVALAMGASAASASDGTLRLGPQQPIGKKPAIVGGTAIPVTQAPWQVYVRSDLDGGRTYACGGSIVDATHVVTAGHCVYDPTTATRVGTAALTVVAGISNVNAPESTRQERGVAAIRVHPGYRYTADNGGVAPDDVAVLALSAPLDLRGPAVRAIALVGSGAYPALGTVATITGFGRQAAGVAPDGGLYAVGTTIGDPLLCGGADNAVVDCVASQVGSACEGDSGGPLTIAGALAGVASFVTTTGPTGTCGVGSWNGYTNLAAPEIRAFVLGDDDPPIAPRGGSDVSAVGVFQAGGTMTCSPGTWSGAPTFAYTFLDTRNGEVLQSGPSAAYAFGDGDVGRTVACQPAATNAGGTGITRTAASPAIAARPSQPAPQPRPAPQPSRPAARRPALRLSVNASAKRARPGATVRHAITVANRGRAAATRVVVCSAPGRGLAFRKLPSAATRSRGRACWSLRTVGAGGRRTVRVTLRVARSARPAVARNAVSVRSANAGRRAVRAGVRVLAVQRGVPVRLR